MTHSRPLRYFVLIVVAGVMILPFLWMVVTSLKKPDALVQFPPQLLPRSPQFSNYATVFRELPIGTFFLNTIKISVLGTIGELIAAALAAFAFARMQFLGKKIILALLLSTMMIPFQVTMIPVYLIINWLGWLDNQASLIVPHFFGGAFASGAFGVF
ncbi:MAG TPA: carbohydrate ABC transporter permease, partial [Candidatus Kapabacteria bacterium]